MSCLLGNLEVSKFGSIGAESLKIGIDSIFSKKGTFEIKHYTEKLVPITTNGALSIPVSITAWWPEWKKTDGTGLCLFSVNHWVELAMKDAFDKSSFNEIDKLYLGRYNLCKNSRAIKTDICEAAETLNISVYSLSRLTGTRFTPRRRALTLFFFNVASNSCRLREHNCCSAS